VIYGVSTQNEKSHAEFRAAQKLPFDLLVDVKGDMAKTYGVGMMFLPEEIWLKGGTLSDDGRALLRTHPGFGAGLLSRMAGWQEAATMVAQHHEVANGKGYPQGLRDSAIVPGAKIISIVDAFESVTLKHSNRGAGRSLLRAVAEINACDDQFSPEWIAHFNIVVRGMLEG
jgi:HD-GYP domain-containing protein (c-di-GMP phosphodiesterase class II)